MQGQEPHDWLSDAVLELFASPLLGRCKVQRLDLTNQGKITRRGIHALAGGRFPGEFSSLFLLALISLRFHLYARAPG